MLLSAIHVTAEIAYLTGGKHVQSTCMRSSAGKTGAKPYLADSMLLIYMIKIMTLACMSTDTDT